MNQRFKPSVSDKKEMRALLVFLSGITKRSAIKRIEFNKTKESDILTIERWDSEFGGMGARTFTTLKYKRKLINHAEGITKGCM